jgi:hypothetical protein
MRTAQLEKNSLGNLIAKISEEYDLSKHYTNHCIRSTCITILDGGGIETRHIIGLNGHKSENSVKSYCARLSDNKKRQISDILSDQVKNVEAPCPAKSARATSVTSATKDPPSTTSSHDGVVELLSDDIEFDSILQDIAAFEANQTNMQNNVNNMPNYLIYAAVSRWIYYQQFNCTFPLS